MKKVGLALARGGSSPIEDKSNGWESKRSSLETLGLRDESLNANRIPIGSIPRSAHPIGNQTPS